MKIAGTVDCTHAANPDDLLHHISLDQHCAGRQLTGLALTRAKILSNIMRIHNNYLNYIRQITDMQSKLPFGFISCYLRLRYCTTLHASGFTE